jgi:hypothetical protein
VLKYCVVTVVLFRGTAHHNTTAAVGVVERQCLILPFRSLLMLHFRSLLD